MDDRRIERRLEMKGANQEKLIRKYAGLYRKALIKQGFSDTEAKTCQYESRLREMLASPRFQEHNVYPTLNVELICAVIAMRLELRGDETETSLRERLKGMYSKAEVTHEEGIACFSCV